MDGEFRNVASGDSAGLFNFYLVNRSSFNAGLSDGTYSEFGPDKGTTQIQVETSELESNYAVPVMKYTPEKIFSGRIPALDINFVNPKDWNDTAMNDRSIAQRLHSTIASWYISLRNLAVVALMLVLVYVGIRIIISSTASDKAKYKQMLMDWLVALCILFCLHYIMTFTVSITTEITQAISGGSSNNGNNIKVVVGTGTTTQPPTPNTNTENESGGYNNPGSSYLTGGSSPTQNSNPYAAAQQDPNYTGTSTAGQDLTFSTDLMGVIRLKMQSPNVGGKVLYLILYIAMVIYTCMFTFYYLKRVLIMAFLTLISPLVAMTYPIDKMRDGKAQAFDMWLKEYVFNALVQPFHLIIYSIFVGSAIDLSVKNPLIAIVTLAFITPAEKMLRKFFGFEKASTAGALGAVASAAGGAAFMNQMQKLMAPKKGSGGKSSSPRTRQRVEGDVKSLGESLGGNPSNSNNQEPQDEGETRFNLQDNEFRDNSGIIGGRSQGELSGDDLPEAASTDGMHMQGGLWVPDADPRGTSVIDEAQPEEPLMPSSNNGTHGRGAFQWSDNDTRGAGEYLGGIARTGASWAGNKIASSQAGQGAIRLGRTISGGARSVRNLAANRIAKPIGDLGRRIIPKPIRNSAGTLARATGRAALGVGNVALQSGLAVGKAALKAAPGAMLGMAAGIAGDELSDIPKYTLAGAALSSTIGSSAVAQAGSFVANAYREGSGGTTPEAIIARQQSEFIKSKEWDDVFQQEFKNEDGSKLTKAQLKARKQQAAYYDSVGFHGEEAVKAVKLEEKIKKDIGQEQQEDFDLQGYTARIKKIAKDYSADKLRDPDKVKTLTNSLEKELMNGGFDKKSAEAQAAKTVKHIKWSKGLKE